MTKSNSFWKMPKLLFTPDYKGLSISAKVVYCFMLERQYRSVENNWQDSDGKPYIYFPVNKLAELLCVSDGKIVRIMRELEEFRLINRVRQGLGRPDKIKVMPLFETESAENSIATYDIREIEKLFDEKL